ncbi:MAG TPA: magnesium/cobalt transporter CorA [Woeseiaceae bacterium]|nr:magnesium/cobalt transporter CorA [Woeseiaceae bacterium]
MLTAYVDDKNRFRKCEVDGDALPPDCVWIDLLHPTRDEERLVEAHLGMEVPTHEDMLEIEASSRLYREGDALFMTAILLSKTDSESPEATPVSFVLSGETLVTIRYSEPRAIEAFITRGQRSVGAYRSGEAVLIGLLEAIVDRTADILERIGLEIEALSREVFEHQSRKADAARELREILRNIGQRGDLNGKARESLVSLGRLLTFLTQGLARESASRELRSRLKTLNRDLASLTDHSSFLSNKFNFLLEATLGMINIEQNAIIKIFSVAAVVFLPPTLIASIYGMNFQFMPELDWHFGYPLAIALMIGSAIVPYLFFKRRGWL